LLWQYHSVNEILFPRPKDLDQDKQGLILAKLSIYREQ
jgi:hypothetical protein